MEENKVYISGPSSLTIHDSTYYKKIFYIFGEIHGNFALCKQDSIEIQDFLDILFKTTNSHLDFILEVHPKMYETHFFDDELILDKLRLKFAKCFFKHCNKYPKVRFHYNDLREVNTIKINNYIYTLKKIIYQDGGDMDLFEKFKFETENFTIDKNLLLNELSTSFKINKQLSKIKNKFISDTIYQFFLNRFDSYYNIISSNFEDFKKKFTLTRKEFLKNIANESKTEYLRFFYILYDIVILAMDIYTIARCFKTPKKIKGKYSEPMKNIIIYTGDFHSENYRQLLGILWFKTKVYIKDTETQCLKIDGLRSN